MATTDKKRDGVIPADWVPGPKQGQWTYSHYVALPDDGHRYEIVDGVLYSMAPPSPSGWHQGAATLLTTYLVLHVQFVGRGRVYAAPLDVELGPKDVVQPDVLVLLNESNGKFVGSHIVGAPDLVVEIASPRTRDRDRQDKQDAYARAGVKEYWIAEPTAQTIEVLILEDGEYHSAGVFSGKQTLPSLIVPEFPVQVQQFFA